MSGRAGNKDKKDAPAKREGAGGERNDDHHGPAEKSAGKAAGAKKGDKK